MTLMKDTYAQHDITESERGNDMSNPTAGEWSLVAPTAKLYQRYLRAWMDPDTHTTHNVENRVSTGNDISSEHLRAWASLEPHQQCPPHGSSMTSAADVNSSIRSTDSAITK